MWIDAHCHLSDPRALAVEENILRECEEAGITRFMLGGVDPDEWDRQTELAAKHPGRFFKAFGMHPWWVHRVAEETAESQAWKAKLGEALDRLKRESSSLTALGEAGLDASRGRLNTSREAQVWAFRQQLALAGETGRPMVLHIVRAHPLALQILEEPEFRKVGGMIHSFSGTWEDARRYLALGWLLSFSARITHPQAARLRHVVQETPGDRLVFETDAPDQPPYGHETNQHTPVSLLKVVKKASEIRGESEELLLSRSRDNLVRAFHLPVS